MTVCISYIRALLCHCLILNVIEQLTRQLIGMTGAAKITLFQR